jgi:hypothetical protein
MEFGIGDILTMKKPHPCGCNTFLVLRTGVDLKLKCQKCGHEVMAARVKILRNIKNVQKGEGYEPPKLHYLD